MGRRIAWIAIGAIALALLVLPIVAGFAIERGYRALLERARESVAELEVEGGFERGLFASRARTRIRLVGQPEVDTIELDHWISHGPIPLAEIVRGRSPFTLVAAVVDTGIAADPDSTPPIAEASDGGSLPRLVTWLDPDRSTRWRIASPPIALASADSPSGGFEAHARVSPEGRVEEGELTWGAVDLRQGAFAWRIEAGRADFEVVPSSDGEPPAAWLRVEPLQIEGPGGRLRVAPSTVRLTGAYAGVDVDVDALDLRVGDIVVESDPDASGPTTTLRGLRLHQRGAKSLDTGLRDVETEVAFEALETSVGLLGPGRADLVARDIDPDAFAGSIAALRGSVPDDSDPDAGDDAARTWLDERLAAFFATVPEIVLERLSLETPLGVIEGTGRMRRVEPSASGADVAAPRVAGSLDLELPERLVAGTIEAFILSTVLAGVGGADGGDADLASASAFMAELALAELVGRGLLVEHGERLRVELVFDERGTTVNGQPLPENLLPTPPGAPAPSALQ